MTTASIDELFAKIKSGGEAPLPPVSWLIVGLGNPGREYDGTRHNVGFLSVDKIAEKAGVRIDRLAHKALTGRGRIGETGVLFMKPQTYMNLSGEAVSDAASFYKIPPEHVLVFCDDVSFDVGVMRIRRNGSHGGHNGLRNISLLLGSDAYPRIKLGVGKKPHPDYDLADWVLGKLSKDDLGKYSCMTDALFDTATLIIDGKIEDAMCKYSH